MCARIIVHNCRMVRTTAQNGSSNFPSYPPEANFLNSRRAKRKQDTLYNVATGLEISRRVNHTVSLMKKTN